jgi:hypothetical protein
MTSQGEQHFYDFTASAGTTLHIESKCYCANLMVRATRAGDASRFGFQELNRLSDDWTLPSGGRYTLQLRSDGFTGDYSFSVSQKTAHTH